LAELTLASRSPQRRAILEQLGIEFEVESPTAPELGEGDPRSVVIENARRKARAVGGHDVLAADTVVVLDERIFGKPAGAAEAEAFLRRLSGRTHQVVSGVVLRRRGGERGEVAVTRVRFRALEQAQIDWYVATREWEGRAGGYAIQGRGAALVAGIEGDYSNVVGLPVTLLVQLLPELFAGVG
jgi:septum formation protein